MGCYYAGSDQKTNPINILPIAQKRVKIELAIDVIHHSAMSIIRLHGHSDYGHRNKSPANPRNIQPNIRGMGLVIDFFKREIFYFFGHHKTSFYDHLPYRKKIFLEFKILLLC